MEPSEALFDDDFIKKLEYLNLVSKQMVPGHLHGEHRSKKKTSSGIEFSDYRDYAGRYYNVFILTFVLYKMGVGRK